jgi:PEGA domain
MQKSFLSLFIVVLFSINLTAQISVESFNVLQSDQTARITDPIIDQNGEKCALIRVVTTESGFEFEAGMLGIMKTVKKTGEYWVYIPHGSKRISILHNHLGVLRDYIFPEAIQQATVYEMVLTTNIVKTVVEERLLQSQWVVIATEPGGADVYIDEKHCGQTPFQQEFVEGKHSYRISKDLYHSEAGKFELSIANETQKINLKLKPNYGFVNIKSFPESGAGIFIDAVAQKAETPHKTGKVKSGTHTLLLTHFWYENVQKEFEVMDGETTELYVTMKPKFADVSIEALGGAEIFLDGKQEGTGHLSKRLMAGTYVLKLKMPNYHDLEENIEVNAGVPFSKRYELQPAFGGISIATSPENGAEVIVDGISTHKVTPCTIEHLSSGEHLVSLRREWYEPKKFQIEVEDGKSQNITQELMPTFVDVSINTLAEADIYIDRQKVAKGKFYGRVKTGIHTFEARLDKHHADQKKEEIILGHKYDFQLSPRPQFGTLKVVTNPFDADISLNGDNSGTTPKTFNSLLVGEYKLKLSKKGYAPVSKTLLIVEGQTEIVNVDLQSGKRVSFDSSPQGAKLLIDKEYIGTTPFVTDLSFGNHDVEILKDAHEKISKTIIVSSASQADNNYKYSLVSHAYRQRIKSSKRRKRRNNWNDVLSAPFVLNDKNDEQYPLRIFYSYQKSNIGLVENKTEFSERDYSDEGKWQFNYTSIWDTAFNSSITAHKIGVGIRKIAFLDVYLGYLRHKDFKLGGLGFAGGFCSHIPDSRLDFFIGGDVTFYFSKYWKPAEYGLSLGVKYWLAEMLNIEFAYVISGWTANKKYVLPDETGTIITSEDNEFDYPEEIEQYDIISCKNYFKFGVSINFGD